MPLYRQLGLIALAGAFLCPLGAVAQSVTAQQTLTHFDHFYNLQHTLLTGMAEQDCVSLNRNFCFKIGLRSVNTMGAASANTLWISASYRLTESIHAGLTLDPGVYEKLPESYETSNRRPSIAGFTTMQFGEFIQARFSVAYSSSTPKYAQDELSRYRDETSTQTSGLLGGVEVAYQQPFGLGFIQPYLHVYASQINQRDDTAFAHADKHLSVMTARTGFRTIYAFNDWIHLSFNLHAERDIRTSMQQHQQHVDHTDVYMIATHHKNDLRFGSSLGGRLILGDKSELTAFVSQFSQAFGTQLGTGASLYFLQRF